MKTRNPQEPPSEVAPESSDGEHWVRRNFIRLALFQISLRVGWIFKTESVIIPAFLDIIGGQGWLRGCLPMLNRFGQSIPPMLVSQQVSNLPKKKLALAVTTFCMGAAFLLLSVIWYLTKGKFAAMPFVFLTIYAFFFIATGISQLLINTLIGKLIRNTLRGRLAATGSVIGGTIAVLCAWFLLRTWLGAEGGRFELVFGFAGIMFLIASLVSLTFAEQADTETTVVQKPIPLLKTALQNVRGDRNLKRLMLVASMFGMCVVLTPHYQTLARVRLDVDFRSLIPWVIAQHIGASAITVPMGWLADRFGNRIVLRTLMSLLCVTPILGLVLSWSGDTGRLLFPVVFFLLGLIPITVRFLNNYTLEVADRNQHPLYLSTLAIFMSAPVIATSLIFGALVDIIGFEAVYLIVLAFLLVGLNTTFRLEEPRHAVNQ
jgi:MFS family permease